MEIQTVENENLFETLVSEFYREIILVFMAVEMKMTILPYQIIFFQFFEWFFFFFWAALY